MVVVAAAVAAAGTWWAMARQGAAKPAEPAPVDVSLEPFTTNLRDGRVVQVTLVLRVAGPEAADELEHGRMADVRHQVYRVLRGMTAADLAGTAGMDRLRQAVWHALADPADGAVPGQGQAPASDGTSAAASPAGGGGAAAAAAGSPGAEAGAAAGPGAGVGGLGLPIREVLITDLIVQ